MVRQRTKTRAHFFKDLNLSQILEPEDPMKVGFTATKLIGTMGPATRAPGVLSSMLEAGMAAARVDLTWGPFEFHRKSLVQLNEAMQKSRRLCATMVDTLGREVMVKRPFKLGEDGWPVHADPMHIKAGQRVTLTARPEATFSENVLPVTYSKLPSMAEVGDAMYIGRYLVCGADEASLYLEVEAVNGPDIVCVAKNDAVLDGLLTVFHMERSSEQLLNLQNDLPVLSEYDQECLAALAQDFELDFLCLSFARNGDDVRTARAFLDSVGLTHTRVLAKLETRQALLNLRSILSEADGIIMSRGNLGLDVVPEKMALVQKMIIQTCNLIGKPIIITRVVDTMVSNPRPTRAEATDVANAVLDGCDAIMLGAETLRGAYPLESLTTISQICRVAEEVFDNKSHYEYLMETATAMDFGSHHLQPHAGSSVRGPSDSEEGGSPRSGISPLSSMNDVTASVDPSSYEDLETAFYNTAKFGASSVANLSMYGASQGRNGRNHHLPLLSKLESLASSAVRAAEKVGADLIVVYTSTGKTAQLVAKYRPPMPIVTLVVPRLVSDSLKWSLEGRSIARQCLLSRGLLPVLASPGPAGDEVLEAAIVEAARQRLVRPNRHVVCVQQIHEDFCVKIMSVDEMGAGIKKRISSTLDIMGKLSVRTNVPGGVVGDSEDDDVQLDSNGAPVAIDDEKKNKGSFFQNMVSPMPKAPLGA